MEQFIVSARKYRPVVFDDVVGQKHIASTLRNAIKNSQLAQAFLFSGPRGVGKTTCARILAKTINCFSRTDNIDACEKCESCNSFNQGHSLNIYELDAASNNGVEDIRLLIEQVRFAPQLGNKKVYIIDEVHMLSASAFNAFLKTLEEPPAHAIFILATTEKHKIIPTILSRCQVFDFNRIETNDIVARLTEIGEKENITVEKDALHLIADRSDGSLRDALSLFDQLATFSGGKLTYDSVVENLGIISSDYFFNLTEFLQKAEIASALKLFDEILRRGFDGHHFILGLASHLRNLLLAQDKASAELITAGPRIRDLFASTAASMSPAFILRALNLCARADLNYKISRNQRLLVELCLINIAQKDVEKTEASVPKASNTAAPKAEKKVSAEVTPIPKVEAKSPAPANKVTPPPTKPQSPAAKEVVSTTSDANTTTTVVQTTGKKKFASVMDTGSVSISSFTTKSENRENAIASESEVKYSEALTEEKLTEGWKELLQRYDAEGKFNLHVTLSKYNPLLADENTIDIRYDNKSQLDSITAEKVNIVSWLRKSMRNDLLTIKLTAADRNDQKAYTPTEKLEKLIEKNPNINLLKNNLDLELI